MNRGKNIHVTGSLLFGGVNISWWCSWKLVLTMAKSCSVGYYLNLSESKSDFDIPLFEAFRWPFQIWFWLLFDLEPLLCCADLLAVLRTCQDVSCLRAFEQILFLILGMPSLPIVLPTNTYFLYHLLPKASPDTPFFPMRPSAEPHSVSKKNSSCDNKSSLLLNAFCVPVSVLLLVIPFIPHCPVKKALS